MSTSTLIENSSTSLSPKSVAAKLLGRLAKGVPKQLVDSDRQLRRVSMIKINERKKALRLKRKSEKTTPA